MATLLTRRLLLSLLTGASACITDPDPNAVDLQSMSLTGSKVVDDTQWPSVVWLDVGCTAVVIHPRVLIYPAHCHGNIRSAFVAGESLDIEACNQYPNGRLLGTDIGYCTLRNAFSGTIVAPVSPCEVAAFEPETLGIVVGFGETEDSIAGRKQMAAVTIDEVDLEIKVSAPGFGACGGDSGSALIVPPADNTLQDSRVIGILSSSSTPECAESPVWFTRLWPFLDWIEAASGEDISPCANPERWIESRDKDSAIPGALAGSATSAATQDDRSDDRQASRSGASAAAGSRGCSLDPHSERPTSSVLHLLLFGIAIAVRRLHISTQQQKRQSARS